MPLIMRYKGEKAVYAILMEKRQHSRLPRLQFSLLLFLTVLLAPQAGARTLAEDIGDWTFRDLGWEEIAWTDQDLASFNQLKYRGIKEVVENYGLYSTPYHSFGHIQGMAFWPAQGGWVFSHDNTKGVGIKGAAIIVLCTGQDGCAYATDLDTALQNATGDPTAQIPRDNNWHHPSGIQVAGNILVVTAGGMVRFMDIRNPAEPKLLDCKFDYSSKDLRSGQSGAFGAVGFTFHPGLNRYIVNIQGVIRVSRTDNILDENCVFDEVKDGNGPLAPSKEALTQIFPKDVRIVGQDNRFVGLSIQRDWASTGGADLETDEIVVIQELSLTKGGFCESPCDPDWQLNLINMPVPLTERFSGEGLIWPGASARWAGTVALTRDKEYGSVMRVITAPRNFIAPFYTRMYSNLGKGKVAQHLASDSLQTFAATSDPHDGGIFNQTAFPLVSTSSSRFDWDTFLIRAHQTGFLKVEMENTSPPMTLWLRNGNQEQKVIAGSVTGVQSTGWLAVEEGNLVDLTVYPAHAEHPTLLPGQTAVYTLDIQSREATAGPTNLAIGMTSSGEISSGATSPDIFDIDTGPGFYDVEKKMVMEIRVESDDGVRVIEAERHRPDYNRLWLGESNPPFYIPTIPNVTSRVWVDGPRTGASYEFSTKLHLGCDSNLYRPKDHPDCTDPDPVTDDHADIWNVDLATPVDASAAVDGILDENDLDCFTLTDDASVPVSFLYGFNFGPGGWVDLTLETDRPQDVVTNAYVAKPGEFGTISYSKASITRLSSGNEKTLRFFQSGYYHSVCLYNSSSEALDYTVSTTFPPACPNEEMALSDPICQPDQHGEDFSALSPLNFMTVTSGIIDTPYDRDAFLFNIPATTPANQRLYVEVDGAVSVRSFGQDLFPAEFSSAAPSAGGRILGLDAVAGQNAYLRVSGEEGENYSFSGALAEPCYLDNHLPAGHVDCPQDIHGDSIPGDTTILHVPLEQPVPGKFHEQSDYDLFEFPLPPDTVGGYVAVTLDSRDIPVHYWYRPDAQPYGATETLRFNAEGSGYVLNIPVLNEHPALSLSGEGLEGARYSLKAVHSEELVGTLDRHGNSTTNPTILEVPVADSASVKGFWHDPADYDVFEFQIPATNTYDYLVVYLKAPALPIHYWYASQTAQVYDGIEEIHALPDGSGFILNMPITAGDPALSLSGQGLWLQDYSVYAMMSDTPLKKDISRGDVNEDGQVDELDGQVIESLYGSCTITGEDHKAEFSGDNCISEDDFDNWDVSYFQPTQALVADGDVNGDGQVDVKDMLLAMRILNGQYIPSQEELHRWDVAPLVNGVPTPDQQNNLGDYLILQRKVLGIINF